MRRSVVEAFESCGAQPVPDCWQGADITGIRYPVGLPGLCDDTIGISRAEYWCEVFVEHCPLRRGLSQERHICSDVISNRRQVTALGLEPAITRTIVELDVATLERMIG